jgi:hypothetical protein
MTDRAAPGATFDHLSVKGFGDLVIALACLRRVPAARTGLRFLLGAHLVPLWAVLDPPFAHLVLPRAEPGPAVLFKALSSPPRAVAASAWDLRRAIGRGRGSARSATLLFDEWDIRHRFLGLGARARGLPAEDNLYRRWQAFGREQGWAGEAPAPAPALAGRLLRIFPGAREENRRLPVPLLRDLVARARDAGLEPEVCSVAGEMPQLRDAGLPLHEMPRDFAATVAAVAGADRVISADSMTAHLAEYLGRPVFVLSPTLKWYWLPLSAATGRWHALFGDPPEATRLPTFLR